MKTKEVRWATIALVAIACAPSRPAAYTSRSDAAQKAYASGRYREAASEWLAAAKAADERRLRVEAEFRAAASFERAGDTARARALYEKLASEPSERSERAAFAVAFLDLGHGDRARGLQLLDQALAKSPNSGVAGGALERRLAFAREQGGSEAVLKYLDELEPRTRNTELAEHVAYARARELDAMGATLEARDAYLATAARFPYPHGSYWDDALYRAARCELALGRPRQAIAHLERLLADREQAHLQGSYERTRYAEARWLIAETYRDKLGELDRARREFRRLWDEHPTSLLADDALWNEALTAARSAGPAEACAPLRVLVSERPDSRYAPCADRLCPGLRTPTRRRCNDYIVRQLEAVKGAKP